MDYIVSLESIPVAKLLDIIKADTCGCCRKHQINDVRYKVLETLANRNELEDYYKTLVSDPMFKYIYTKNKRQLLRICKDLGYVMNRQLTRIAMVKFLYVVKCEYVEKEHIYNATMNLAQYNCDSTKFYFYIYLYSYDINDVSDNDMKNIIHKLLSSRNISIVIATISYISNTKYRKYINSSVASDEITRCIISFVEDEINSI